MAKIVINEVSQDYTFNIGNNSYACVALPITSCWGPGYFNPVTYYGDNFGSDSEAIQKMLEHTAWQRFPATQSGLEAFVATYRGPASNYRRTKDFSYQIAVTLLTSGYDVLVCRMCPGTHATGQLTQAPASGEGDPSVIKFRAKYPGTFGNNLQIVIKKVSYFDRSATASNFTKYYWNILTYVIDPSGVRSAVESKALVFNADNSTDEVLYYKDVDSDFWDITQVVGTIEESAEANIPSAIDPAYPDQPAQPYVKLGQTAQTQGTDYDTATTVTPANLAAIAQARYDWAKNYQMSTDAAYDVYPTAISTTFYTGLDAETLKILYSREWILTHLTSTGALDDSGEELGGVYDLLKDKLAYNPQRLISPGWDDQDYFQYTDDVIAVSRVINGDHPEDVTTCKVPVSPMHLKIMDTCYYSRCATGFIDVPHVVDRKFVHIEDETDPDRQGYVQKLARVTAKNAALDTNGTLYHTHYAFFAPWGQYTYVGTGKMNVASPSFLALMIQRAQILNQPIQYEWALPTNRKHNLRIGKMDYNVPKKLLDQWQKLDGASVNVITPIPDLGTNIWGNSTGYEVPPVTYQALANLSTRYLVNAVEDVAYKCGMNITFQYNNNQAYNKFYAGVTPTLDTMKNVGAIDDYRVEMSADINGLDHVNANTVIGKIWLIVNGVINDIYVDLIALPAGLGIDLNSLS